MFSAFLLLFLPHLLRKILIKRAGQAPVAEFAALVRPLAVHLLEVVHAGDDADVPAGKAVENAVHIPIEVGGLLARKHSFPIGRVAEEEPLLVVRLQLLDGPHLPVDLHPRLLGVTAGNGHGSFVYVVPKDGEPVVPLLLPGPLPGFRKDAIIQKGPVLRSEAPVQGGGLVVADHGRLDGHGAAAAHGVDEGCVGPVPA